jgi:hypothetical protein
MVVSLEFKSRHSVGVNTNEKYKLIKGDKETVESIKNIPMVIYNGFFDREFIIENIDKFKYSCHVLMLDYDDINDDIILEANKIGVGVIVRVPVLQEGEEIKLCVMYKSLDWSRVDRVVVLDKTSTMQITHLNDIKNELSKVTGHSKNDIGVCGSPFSFGESACLCAVWARRIMAKYISNTEVALPSANHEDMEECGCIRKIVITSDIDAPVVKSASSNGGSASNKESKPKVVRGVSNIRGLF